MRPSTGSFPDRHPSQSPHMGPRHQACQESPSTHSFRTTPTSCLHGSRIVAMLRSGPVSSGRRLATALPKVCGSALLATFIPSLSSTSPPGTGGVFSSMPSTIGDMVLDMAVNNNSQTAVWCYWQVGSGDLRSGIFATDVNGVLKKIVADGDMIEVSPGVFRQVVNLNFQGDREFSPANRIR